MMVGEKIASLENRSKTAFEDIQWNLMVIGQIIAKLLVEKFD